MLIDLFRCLRFLRKATQRQWRKSNKTLLLIGIWANRNWILGNWLKEINCRYPMETRIWWVLSVYAKKHFWEALVRFPLPTHESYFFSYPAIFQRYYMSNPQKYGLKSIVNYTHNEEELGSLHHQAKILNCAYSVHFNSSRDAEALVRHGLDSKKVRLVFGAIDDECFQVQDNCKDSKTLLLASRFGPRKGLEVLPKIIKALSDWEFRILGRGWEEFLMITGLIKQENVTYFNFNKDSRNKIMSRTSVFLSLSNLEGGPIPLIESMAFECVPIATDTGFARDFIKQDINGFIIPVNPNPSSVIDAIGRIDSITENPKNAVAHLTWNRIAKIVMSDYESISTSSQKP